MIRANRYLWRLLSIWPITGLGATVARRISAQNATPNHTMSVRHAIRTMLHCADSVMSNSNRHLQVWSQLSETFAEKETASIWCNSLATRCLPVDIHAAELLERDNACHASSQSVSQRWIQLSLQKRTKKTSVTSAIAQVLGKSLVFTWNVAISITSAVWRVR